MNNKCTAEYTKIVWFAYLSVSPYSTKFHIKDYPMGILLAVKTHNKTA